MKNHGFNLDLERLHRQDSDWVFGGASQPCLASIPEEEREKYLPDGERQNIGSEKNDCATRSPLNVLETKFNYLYKNNKLKPENKKWLEDTGYIENGKPAFSDRFIAILSGTKPDGNSLKAPIDAIHRYGLIPKKLFPQVSDYNEYYDKTKITDQMIKIGEEFLRRFAINYERVLEIHLKEALKDDMLCVAGYAWPTPVNGVYPKVDYPPNHAWMNFKPLSFAFDNYEESEGDFIKQLSPDYDYYDTCYRVFISKEVTDEEREVGLSVFNVLLEKGLLAFFAEFWRRLTEKKPTETEVTETETVETENEPLMDFTVKTLREKIHEEAIKWLGKDASPLNQAPSHLACMEAVNEIFKNVTGYYISPRNPLSTYWAYLEMKRRKAEFDVVLEPKAGDIIIAPTGFNSPTAPIDHGHIGIFMDSENIASNNSRNGKFEINYTLKSFRDYYSVKGGYPVIIFRAISTV